MGRDAGVFGVGLKGQCDGRFVLTGVLARAARLLVAELARRQQLSHIASSTFGGRGESNNDRFLHARESHIGLE